MDQVVYAGLVEERFTVVSDIERAVTGGTFGGQLRVVRLSERDWWSWLTGFLTHESPGR